MPKMLTCALCATPMYGGPTSLPQGISVCQPCKRAFPKLGPSAPPRSTYVPALPRRCVVCDVETKPGAVKCDQHKGYRRTSCTTCGTTTYNLNSNKPGRNVYCPECKPITTIGEWLGRTARESVTRLDWTQCGCGTWLSRPGYKYCSPQCRPTPRIRADPQCRRCATPLLSASWKRHCDPCLRDIKREARKKYGNRHRTRARYHGVEYQPVQPMKVYERDGWRCGICHDPVDKTLTWPDQMCPSLDHVIPMARGGPHTYANTQLAHWLCNSLKSDTDLSFVVENIA